MRLLTRSAPLFLAALAVRILAGAWAGHFSNPVLWEQEVIANNLLAGRGFLLNDHLGTSYRAFALPAYPLLCAFVYRLTNHSHAVLLLLQCALSAASCLQIRAIGRLLFPDSRVPTGGAWLTALHPGLIYYATELHPLTLDLFTYLWTLWACVALFQRPAVGRAAHLGIAAGLALLSRGTLLLFLLLAGAAFLRRAGQERSLRRAVRFSGIAAVTATLVVLPWLARNALLFKHFPVFITSSNQSLWAGNNALSTGTLHGRDGRPLVHQLPPQLERALAQTDEMGQSDLFRREAWAFIRQEPWEAARLYARKWGIFWSASSTVGLYYPRAYTRVYLLWYFAAMALAMVGLGSLRRELLSPPLLLLSLFPLSIALFQCLYYVEGRHRWTVEPVLLLLTAQGALFLRQRISRCASS